MAPTFAAEMKSTDAVLIAKLVNRGKREGAAEKIAGELGIGTTNPTSVGKSDLEIIKVIKGEKFLKVGDNIQAYVFGDAVKGDSFFVTGVEPPAFSWSTQRATKRVVDYVSKITSLPVAGPERLTFFLNHLEDSEEMLARDSYDEFALAPLEDVKGIKELVDKEKIRKWIEDEDIPSSRKGLYFTLLGISGGPKDAKFLEGLMRSGEARKKTALDAMIACYITLKGAGGLKLIEDLFLINKDASYSDSYAAIAALRFHSTEEKILNKKQIAGSLRHMLEREDVADLVVADLARLEDWSVIDKLVKLFKEADPETSWIRMPIVNYLRACPLPKATKVVAELEKIDPKTFKRARAFFPEYDLDDDGELDDESDSKDKPESKDKKTDDETSDQVNARTAL